MKTDYIVLRAKQPNTRDLFSGAAASWAILSDSSTQTPWQLPPAPAPP